MYVAQRIVIQNIHATQWGINMNVYKRIIIPLVIAMALLLILYANQQQPGRPNYYDSPIMEDTGERYG